MYRKTVEKDRGRVLVAFYDDEGTRGMHPVVHVLEKQYTGITEGDRNWNRDIIYLCSGAEYTYESHTASSWDDIDKDTGREMWNALLEEGFSVIRLGMEWTKGRPMNFEERERKKGLRGFKSIQVPVVKTPFAPFPFKVTP